jgi:medium-chain acyl-[acyl-carrier-protein] hydrolase
MKLIHRYLKKLPSSDPKTELRLFCFPYGGAGVSIFRDWYHALPKSIELCPVQLPGREERLSERPFTNMISLITELGEQLESYLDKPYAFFGHSMGALISFELTRYIRRSKLLQPTYVFASGCSAPQTLKTSSPIFELPNSEFIEKLRQMKGTSESIIQNSELMELLLPLIKADFELCETYKYNHEPPLELPFYVFGGLEDLSVSKDSLVAWCNQTTSRVQLKMFPGEHFFILNYQQPIIEIIRKTLSASLAV